MPLVNGMGMFQQYLKEDNWSSNIYLSLSITLVYSMSTDNSMLLHVIINGIDKHW